MENNSKFNFREIGKSLLVMGVGLFVVFAVSIILAKFKQQPEEPTKPTINCPSDFNSFSETSKKITLVENKPSNGTNIKLKGYKIILERTGLTSDIDCGYLLYQVSFNDKPVEQNSMALFMRPTNSYFGGHIWPDEKKGAIINDTDTNTQVLIPLSKITYDGTQKSPIKEADWASLLNVSDQIEFEVALSADTPNGKLNLVQFAYKCVNKETGKETDECKLKVIKTEPFGF